jgi:heavy metal sensor kinase
MNTHSLRFRLTFWYAGLLTVVFLLLGTLMVSRLKSYLEDNLLLSQTRRARQIAETLLVNVRQTGEPYVANEIKSLYAPELSNRFIRVSRHDGSVIYRSGPPNDQSFDPADVPPAEPSPKRQFTLKPTLPDGRVLLVAAVRVTAKDDGGSYLVEVGTSAQSIETMLNHLRLLLGIGLPLVVLLAAAGGSVLVKRALTPVEKIAGKAESISQHNLSERLPVARTGDELERLSISLNHMITRLDDAFQNSKRFVADASHELRTPLTVLCGELENLAQDAELARVHRERLGSLLEEVERLSKIVQRLLTLSRLDAGEAQSECVPFDLGQLAVTTADQMALLAEDKHISIQRESAPSVPVQGDRARLKEVVVNLLDNAIKYTSDGGAIHLKVGTSNGHAVLEVSDTGIGIPAEAVPHVFERFYRVDQARPREPDGAGLGLAIVKSICSAHGGTVDLQSAVGSGSRFRVTLPLATERLATERKPELEKNHAN